MFISDCMTRHPILAPPTLPAAEAQKILTENHIRHLPVVDGSRRLVGLVTRQQLLVRADAIGNLSMWEVARYLADLQVSQIMVRAREVVTIRRENIIEDASQVMVERKIGCLPVLDDTGAVVGIVTESDLLRAYQEMLGSSTAGVRATVRIPDRTGELAKLTALIAGNQWSVQGIGTFPARRLPGFHDVVIRIAQASPEEIVAAFALLPDHQLLEVRTSEGEVLRTPMHTGGAPGETSTEFTTTRR